MAKIIYESIDIVNDYLPVLNKHGYTTKDELVVRGATYKHKSGYVVHFSLDDNRHENGGGWSHGKNDINRNPYVYGGTPEELDNHLSKFHKK